jgi:hypothetical protein
MLNLQPYHRFAPFPGNLHVAIQATQSALPEICVLWN